MDAGISVSDDTGARAARLAASSGVSIGELVESGLDALERRQFSERTRRAVDADGGVEDDGHHRTAH